MDVVKQILPLAGACCFGILIGWYVYYINRHRKEQVSAVTDLGALIGVIGGAAVLKLFPAETPLFGAYGVGLVLGFFGYFYSLRGMVKRSPNFTEDYFLDGRRKILAKDEYIPTREEAASSVGGAMVKPAEQGGVEQLKR